MNKNKRADGILLDYVLELNTKGYCITSKPNPILNGVDIMVRKRNLTYQQSIPFDILNEVNIDKEDIIRTIIEELVYKVDERRNDDGDAVGSRKGDLIERDDVLEILYEIKDDDDTPKNYGTILDAIRKVRSIPTKIHTHKTCRDICDKYHETCFMVECQGNCEYCGHQIFKDHIIDILKGEKI